MRRSFTSALTLLIGILIGYNISSYVSIEVQRKLYKIIRQDGDKTYKEYVDRIYQEKPGCTDNLNKVGDNFAIVSSSLYQFSRNIYAERSYVQALSAEQTWRFDQKIAFLLGSSKNEYVENAIESARKSRSIINRDLWQVQSIATCALSGSGGLNAQ